MQTSYKFVDLILSDLFLNPVPEYPFIMRAQYIVEIN